MKLKSILQEFNHDEQSSLTFDHCMFLSTRALVLKNNVGGFLGGRVGAAGTD